jgi:acyl dehydratase
MLNLTIEAARARLGTDLGASEWKLIDQPLVDAFAELTGDRQFIHVDPVAAAATPFGGTIAHGFLTLSLLAVLLPPDLIELEGAKMKVNYGFDRIRFIQPVSVGRRIRARHFLEAIENKDGDRFLFSTDVTVEIEGQAKPALTARWLSMQML